MSDHNTLDDARALLRENLKRCDRFDCARIATRYMSNIGGSHCDEHSAALDSGGFGSAHDIANADRIRRLERAGIL